MTFLRNACEEPLCSGVIVADTAVSRMVGLLRHSALPQDGGLWLLPASSIHTFGMRFSIDVVALDRELRVVALFPSIAPGLVVPLRRGRHSVLELAAGRIAQAGISLGETLVLQRSPA